VHESKRSWSLRAVMQRVAAEGSGVIILLRPNEEPRDLMDSVTHLQEGNARHTTAGVLRTFGIGAQILRDLGIQRMRVLSAPRQLQGLSGFDLEVVDYVE